MARVDYLSDSNGDLQIKNGDFVKGESDFDHVRMICISSPGHFRQYPEVGFNVIRFKNTQGSSKQRFESELRDQLQSDGYKVLNVDLTMPEWWKNFIVNVE